MRLSNALFVAAMFIPAAATIAQSSPAQASAPTASPDSPATLSTPSALLLPPADTVLQIVSGINLQKWKRGTVRDEAGEHINSILHDLQATLPELIKQADAAPTMSQLLPVSRNVAALYDVLLSVVEASRVSAPPDQVGQLEQALSTLSGAQRALDGRLQDSAILLEKQVVDLRAAVQSQTAERAAAAKAVAAAPACPATPPVRKAKKKVMKPASQPGQAAPAAATPPAK
jgi:hypothetical protein